MCVKADDLDTSFSDHFFLSLALDLVGVGVGEVPLVLELLLDDLLRVTLCGDSSAAGAEPPFEPPLL